MKYKKQIDFKTFIKFAGLGAASLSLGIGVGFVLTDGVDAFYNHKYSGLKLTSPGAHYEGGEHNAVITHQFYEELKTDTTEQDVDIAITGIKAGIEQFNSHLHGLKFNLCTEVDGLEKYNIPKVDSIAKRDVRLYMETKENPMEALVMASTHTDVDHFSKLIKNATLTYDKNYLRMVWSKKATPEETFTTSNYVATYVTMHEFGHVIGLAHTDDKNSLMYAKTSFYSQHEFSEEDIKMFKTYCDISYGKEKTTQSVSKKQDTEELLSY